MTDWETIEDVESVGLVAMLDAMLVSISFLGPAGLVGIPAAAFFGTLLISALFEAAGGQEFKHFLCAFLILLPIVFLVTLGKRLSRKPRLIDQIHLIIVILAFLGGLFNPYTSQLYDNYYYTPIFSGISCTLYPSIFFMMLETLLKGGGFFRSIGRFVKRGICILLFVLITLLPLSFLSYTIPTYLISRENANLVDYIVYYQNKDITELRKDWKYDSVQDCINQRLPLVINDVIQDVRNESPQLFDAYGNVSEDNKVDYFNGIQKYLGNRKIENNVGIYISNRKYIGDNTFCIAIFDKERYKYYCYQVDMITKEYSQITVDQYDHAQDMYIR